MRICSIGARNSCPAPFEKDPRHFVAQSESFQENRHELKINDRCSTCCVLSFASLAQAQAGPYKIVKIQLIGGDGGFDYVTADPDGRNLYVARSGPAGHIGVFNLDTLAQVGDIPGTSAHGGAVDTATGHGFATSKPVTMFDAKTFAILKKIDVAGQSRRLPERCLQSPLLHPQPLGAEYHGSRR